MPPRPAEGVPQRELLLRLRYQIDTAIRYPSKPHIETAIRWATEHPRALRGRHFAHNLGARRWDWLHAHGIDPAGSPTEIAGSPAIKEAITPEVTR